MVTFLLLCNLTMWVIYTFEMQKVEDSPVQVRSRIRMEYTIVEYTVASRYFVMSARL